MKNITIDKNIIHGSSGQCVLWNNFEYTAEDIKFTNNLLYGAGAYQFNIRDTINLTFKNNTIINDVGLGAVLLRADISRGGIGVQISEMTNNLLSGFIFYEQGYHSVDYAAENIVNDWIIHTDPSNLNGHENIELNNIAQFNNLFLDYTPLEGSMACSNGIITHGHLVGQSCANL